MSFSLSPQGLSSQGRRLWVITVIVIVSISWRPAGDLVSACAAAAGVLGLASALRQRGATQE
ncbi:MULTISPECIES: hypothetical protein [unclassified Streptomyces]|uniref:hypothetical protein n=1 Tax=unclassified Streptomyces TaxID=2593676 RepID=UPI000DC3ED07|nr:MULTISPECIES: hypothetical protein [unclassified Streptomyces]MYT70026.1 hypothetical protein [Streptomyces sp. SID8367]RAJ88599.1 hypothetical protein K377_02055 [Streptomyces sp. PsTaAH-137]